MKIYKVAPMRRVTDSKGVCHFSGDVVDVNDPLVKTQMSKVVLWDEVPDAPAAPAASATTAAPEELEPQHE